MARVHARKRMQGLHEFNIGVNDFNEVLMSSIDVLMSSIEVLTVRLLTRAVTSQGCCCGNLQIHPLDLEHSLPRGTVSSLRLSSEGQGVKRAW